MSLSYLVLTLSYPKLNNYICYKSIADKTVSGSDGILDGKSNKDVR